MPTGPTSPAVDDARLLERIAPIAQRVARRLAAPDDADDLVQDVMYDCWRQMQAGRWRVRTTLPRFIAGMVRHKHAEACRCRASRLEREARFADELNSCTPVWMDPERMLEEREEETTVERTLCERDPARTSRARLRAFGTREHPRRHPIRRHVAATAGRGAMTGRSGETTGHRREMTGHHRETTAASAEAIHIVDEATAASR